jgi:hypothetical protein
MDQIAKEKEEGKISCGPDHIQVTTQCRGKKKVSFICTYVRVKKGKIRSSQLQW